MNKSYFKACVLAGVIAGLVFVVLEMIMVPVFLEGSPWGPPRMIAAIVLGRGVLPEEGQPVTFDIGILFAAVALHMMLSIVYAMIVGMFTRSVGMGMAIIFGAAIGLAIYYMNFYGFTKQYPWFGMARNWVSVFSHIVFGIVAAIVFKRNYTAVRPMVP